VSVCLAAGALAGCLDFVEPELPERGAPAVARLVVVVSDSGRLTMSGEAEPGFDEDGFRRRFADPTVRVGSMTFEPEGESAAGALIFGSAVAIAGSAVSDTLALLPPAVREIAERPTVRWAGAGRAGPDTLRLNETGGLRLALRTSSEPAGSPPPETRQWFLTLTGDEGAFRLSADGPPPDTIDVPAHFVPAFADTLQVRLVYQQSGTVRDVARYLGLFTLDVRLHWIVRRRDDG
jgi:hypothetical protein